MAEKIPEEKRKLITTADVRVTLSDWSKDLDHFTTQQALEAVKEKGTRVRVNSNRVAQLLRGSVEHEYHKGLRRWVKIKK